MLFNADWVIPSFCPDPFHLSSLWNGAELSHWSRCLKSYFCHVYRPCKAPCHRICPFVLVDWWLTDCEEKGDPRVEGFILQDHNIRTSFGLLGGSRVIGAHIRKGLQDTVLFSLTASSSRWRTYSSVGFYHPGLPSSKSQKQWSFLAFILNFSNGKINRSIPLIHQVLCQAFHHSGMTEKSVFRLNLLFMFELWE